MSTTTQRVSQTVTPVYHNIVHQEPPSVSAEDWTSFDKFTTRIFTSDFCHDHHLTFNARVPTTRAGYLKLKQQLHFNKELKVDDEVRLWFPTSWRREAYIYAHVLNDRVKLHYDHGFVNVSGYLLNIYGSFDFLKNWTEKNGRIGVSHTTSKVHTNFRLKYSEDETVTLYHKTHLRFNEWKFGFQGVVDFKKKNLIKKDLVLGYERPDFSVYLKGIQAWERPTRDFNQWRQFFSHINLTGLYRRNLKEIYGLEVSDRLFR